MDVFTGMDGKNDQDPEVVEQLTSMGFPDDQVQHGIVSGTLAAFVYLWPHAGHMRAACLDAHGLERVLVA